MSRGARAALCAGYAAATFLAFPFPLAGRVIDLGLGFAYVAPALLFLALRGLSPRAAALWAAGASLVAHTLVWHWIYVVTVVYGHAPVAVGVLAPALLAVYPALFAAAFGAAFAALDRRDLANPFAAALLWTALYDHARSFALTGFPWGTLGYAQHRNFALLPLAAFAGVYGLSFVSALGGAGLAELARRRWRAAALAFAGVALAHGVGLALGASAKPASGETVRVAVLQGNIDQDIKWSEAWRERTFQIYADLTREAVRRGARIVVWPETAVPGALEVEASLAASLRSLARETRAWLVVGGVGLELSPDGSRPIHFYDSAFVVADDGATRDRYDKTHLVPFGEYVPLRDLLGVFVSSVASGIAPADVAPGERVRSVIVSPDGDGGFPVGAAVCYELLFPDLMRRFAADGAEILLGMTNDAWYGKTGAPYQFLAITALRSAETGLWTARAANTGVSAFIDGTGRVREQTPIFETALLVADVPRHADPVRATFYVRHGDLFAGLCWALSAALLVRARFVRGGRTPFVRARRR